MRRTKKIKSAFTLIELLLVIVILGAVYGIFFANLTKQPENNNVNENLIKVKSLLLKYEFDKTIELQCSEVDFKCFVLVDGVLKEELKEKLFNSTPTVYSYDNNKNRVRFNDLKLEELESYPIDFVYKIDQYGKTKDMIVEVDNKVYVFNSLFDKPFILESLSDVDEYFESTISKVKDVF
jgi:prepilin-type N-terminal cleavage/methylation domain-containing protein